MPKPEWWRGVRCKVLGHWPEPSSINDSPTECCWFCRWCGDEMFDSDHAAAWKRPWYRWAAIRSLNSEYRMYRPDASPNDPKWWHKVLCVVIVLGIYVLLLWMEGASNEDLRFALLAVPCALVAGFWLYRVREG